MPKGKTPPKAEKREIQRHRPKNGLSANTARAYRSQWAAFAAWCQRHDRPALPASAATVRAYLESRSQDARPPTVQQAARAIDRQHVEAGEPSPLDSQVKAFLRRLSKASTAPAVVEAPAADGAALSLTPADAARVKAAVDAERSKNTLTAYRRAWRQWEQWADVHGAQTLPAAAAAVAAYLTHRAESASMATVRMAAAAISAAHRASANDNPCTSALVKAALRGLARQAAEQGRSGQRQAGALTVEALAAIRATATAPRSGPTGRTESAASARARGLVDVALCQVMADAGLRRSEAAALVWADVETADDGSGRLTVRHSKTDAEGEGATVAITPQAVQDLDAIRNGAAEGAPVFALSDSQIHRRVKAAARAAGLGDGFGGHSGRVGLARRMVTKQAPLPVVMQQGRWVSSRMVSRYTRGETAGAALAYL